ncbi:MAG: RNA polymerase factor sigma-54 [Chloroflexi bacterium]|nr:RNA polymerase factor sigma-54 [Chloroflexota bacterium]
MDLEQQIRPETSFRISPRLIQSTRILALSSVELSQAIEQEMNENPALEVEQLPGCPNCGMTLNDGRCLNCSRPRRDDTQLDSASTWDREDGMYGSSRRSNAGDDEDFDPVAHAAEAETLTEALLSGLRPLLKAEDQPLGDYLVGNLDDRGFLAVSLPQVAAAFQVPVERVEGVLHALQSLEPPGIGARNLQECLLLQLRALAEQGEPQPLAERIIRDDHLREIAQRRWSEVASAAGCRISDVKEAWIFIKQRLTPFPANGFHPAVESARPQALRPDVIIRHSLSGAFEVEVIEAARYELKINDTYLAYYAPQLRSQVSPEDRAHIRDHVVRARFFIDCIRQRWETLRQIAECLVECQREFLEKGVRFLMPLTRSELALKLGLHESTISRATAGKYVLLPDGQTIAFEDFFDASLRIKDAMREILSQERSTGPLSDQHIAERLREHDFFIARRTVAKYRDALGVLPSRYR